MKIRKPPYAARLGLKDGSCLIICTGTGAWERAKSTTWYKNCKVALPYGEDPALFDWQFVCGHDLVVGGFGVLEPIDSIARLGSFLLAAGAKLIVYAPEHGPIIRIDAHQEAS